MLIKKKSFKPKRFYPFKSQLEKNIYQIIQKSFPKLNIQINKKRLIKNNKTFELDLYFPKYKIGIEIQGPFHMKNEMVILRDFKKKMLFLQNNIEIIYIYTNTYQNKKYGIKKCIKIINDQEK